MTAQSFRPGKAIVVESPSPSAAFGAVFEDDGETGYLYAYVPDRSDSARILDAVLIYAVARLPDKARHVDSDLAIDWSSDGLKAGLRLNGSLQAVLDFAAREAFARSNFPTMAGWGGGARKPWHDGLVERLR